MKIDIKGLHHDHIDGSRAILDVLDELHVLAGKQSRFPTPNALREFLRNPLDNIVERFAAVTGLMQSREAMELVGYAYGKRRANEGYRYVEGKFAPQYHTSGRLSMKQATAAMIDGLTRAQSEFGIRILPVICIGREADPDTGVEIAKIALDYDGEAAIDLVCDEALHPPEKHLPAYKLTFGSNVRRDCHAGEWVAREPRRYKERLLKNVRTAVYDLKCHGIGHAIPLASDLDEGGELVKYIVANHIRIAGNPLSNLSLGLIRNVLDLRIDELLDCGVIYTLNQDDDLFLPSMDDVVEHCQMAYRFTLEQRAQLKENVYRGAFAPDIMTLAKH
jgi:adenosine deaminase